MSLNAMGLGVVMSVKDGLTKGIDSATKAFKSFSTGMTTARDAGAGLAAIPLKIAGSFMPLAGQVQGMANDYKITTTGIEAFGVAANKVTSAQLSGMNLTSKELKKAKGQIAGIAFGMNTDVGSVTDSFVALKQAGVDVKKVGFKNFEEYQKFVEVAGVDSKQFANAIGKLGTKFGMTDDNVKDTVTTVVALGKNFNVGREAAQNMAGTVSMLAEEGASLWAELGPEKTKQFLVGTQALSIGFMKAGHSAQEAQDLALGVGRAMVKGRTGMESLFAGLQEDLPDVTQALTENFGSAGAAFDLMQKDPAKFAKSMAIASAAVRKNAKSPQDAERQLSRFSLQMTESFGPGFAGLITGSSDKAIAAFNEVEGTLKNGLANKDGVFKDMAKGYSDGRTAAERLSIAQDIFRTKLKKFMNETDGQFLKRFNVSAKVTQKKLEEIASGSGPLAKATKLMVSFANHGIGGVASMISTKYGPAMATMIQQFGPVLSQVPAMVAAFGALFNPLTLATGAIAGLVYYFKGMKEGGNSFTKTVDAVGAKVKGVFLTAVSMAKQLLPKIADYFVSLFNQIDWSAVADGIAEAGGVLWSYIVKGMKLMINGAGWLIDAFSDIDWGKIVPYVAKGAEMVMGALIKVITTIVPKLPRLFLGMLKMFYNAVVGVFDGLEKALLTAFPNAVKIIRVALFGLKVAAVIVFLSIAASAVTAAAGMVAAAAAAAAAWVAALGPISLVVAAVGGIIFAAKALWEVFTHDGTMKESLSNLRESAHSASVSAAADFYELRMKSIDLKYSLEKINDQDFNKFTGTFGKMTGDFVTSMTAQREALEKVNAAQDLYAKLRTKLSNVENGTDDQDHSLDYREVTNGLALGLAKAGEAGEKANREFLDSFVANQRALAGLAEETGIKVFDLQQVLGKSSEVFKATIIQSNNLLGAQSEGAKTMASVVERAEHDLQDSLTTLGEKYKSHAINQAQYEAGIAGITSSLDKFKVSASDMSRIIDAELKFPDATIDKIGNAADVAFTQNIKYKQKMLTELAAFPQEVQDKLKPAYDKAIADHDAMTTELAKNGKLTITQLEQEATAGTDAILASVRRLATQYNSADALGFTPDAIKQSFVDAAGAAADGIEKAKPKLVSAAAGTGKSAVAAMVNDVKAVTAKELGINQEDSVDILKRLIGKNKDQIIANIREIGKAYSTFLDSAAKGGTKLMDTARTGFNTYMTNQRKLWTVDMVKIITDFKTAGLRIMDEFWMKLIDTSVAKTQELVKVLNGTMERLGQAMSGDVTVTANPASQSAQTSPLRPLDNLIAHIDHPQWSNEMMYELKKQHAENKKYSELMIDLMVEKTGITNARVKKLATDNDNIFPSE